jgi:hypothetical protein
MVPALLTTCRGALLPVVANMCTACRRVDAALDPASQTVSLAVYRPFRFNGSGKDPRSPKYFVPDNVSGSYTAFWSQESGQAAPALTLTLSP